jgi:GNAT superfamily N-acetyltransferase
MNKVPIHQAALTDIETLAVLFDAYRQFYGRASDVKAARAFLLNRFEHGESVLFLAFLGHEPVGFTQLYPSFSSLSLARTYVLNDLFVHPSVRKKGVGAGLIHAATAYAKSVGAVYLSLSTATTNTTAQSLYQALGWKRDDHYLTYEFAVQG